MKPSYKKLPELLAPAGSFDALLAAIDGGADAVYLGASVFNARMRAKNFSDDELTEALSLCNSYGVKTYVTLNTRLRDRELPEAASCALDLWEKGASAFIVADIALAKLLKKILPEVEIHASTQASGHSSYDMKALSDFGFSRAVCPRELSMEEIAQLCKKSPIEIEMFIHGAHCVSFSGQCMMSFCLGGRSGNRGECAQPCRLPFTLGNVKNKYPLSLKDMCLAGRMVDIIDTGVASLKIEGRQKSADYVWGVTKIYRRLLDERRNATDEEIQSLSRLFCRGGFTDGYFASRYQSMLGVRSDGDKEQSRGIDTFPGLKRKISLDAKLTLSIGEKAVLTVCDGERTARVTGDEVTFDSLRAISREAALKNMSRLGNTEYILGDFELASEEGAFYTLSGINALRRSALEKLSSEKSLPIEKREEAVKSAKEKLNGALKKDAVKNEKTIKSAEFVSFSQVTDKALRYFDKIYLPLGYIERADGNKICLMLPPVTTDRQLEASVKVISSHGYRGEVLVHGFGQARAISESGLVPVASMRFNVFSASSAAAVAEAADAPCISPEVPLAVSKGCEATVLVYGRIPLMHTMRCMLSDGGSACPFGGGGGHITPSKIKKEGKRENLACDGTVCRGVLRDRMGAEFPVFGLEDCTNVIYNSVPVYMADRKPRGNARHHFIFTTENERDVDFIIDCYEKEKAPAKGMGIKRLK